MNIGKGKIWTIILVPLGGFLLWGILGNLLDHLLDSVGFYEKVMSLNPQNWFRQFYLLTVPVWKLLLSLIVLGIPTYFLLRDKIVWRKRKTRQEQLYDLIDEFKLEKRYVNGNTKGIEYRTHLEFSNDDVTLKRIEPYCSDHEIRMKMVLEDKMTPYFEYEEYMCLHKGCKSILPLTTMDNDQQIILSRLENEWFNLFKMIK